MKKDQNAEPENPENPNDIDILPYKINGRAGHTSEQADDWTHSERVESEIEMRRNKKREAGCEACERVGEWESELGEDKNETSFKIHHRLVR